MADPQTLAAYDKDAAAFAEDWHSQPAPDDLHDIVRRYFVADGRTADIGCGSGREVAWLSANHYPAEGFDASAGLLTEAHARYPHLTFAHATLPDLAGIAADTYDNVLCETVIMHLDQSVVAGSVGRMLEITKPGGVLYLSWRVTEGADARDAHGRLYAAVDTQAVLAELSATTLLLNERVVSSSSGKIISRLVAKKAA